MNDLISRQAAIDAARKCAVKEVTPAYMLIDKAEVMTELMILPPAQPEIVRCKDCGKREVCRTSTVWAVAPSDDWFCADAERREDG